MRVILIANQKGGVGKSTLNCLLAFYLAEQQNGRVAVIDICAQRNLSHTLRQFDIDVPSHLLFEDTPVTLPAVRKNITLFKATPQLANIDGAALTEGAKRLRTFTAQVEALAEHFDFCLIDTPPTSGLRMIAALASADFITMPIELEEYSMQGVKDMLQTIFGTRQKYNPRLKFVGILPNRFMHNSVAQKAGLSALFTDYAQFVLPYKISTRVAIPRALAEGKPVWHLTSTAALAASTEVLHVFDALMKAMAPATSDSAPS